MARLPLQPPAYLPVNTLPQRAYGTFATRQIYLTSIKEHLEEPRNELGIPDNDALQSRREIGHGTVRIVESNSRGPFRLELWISLPKRLANFRVQLKENIPNILLMAL